MATIRQKCESILNGLNSDYLEYVISAVEGYDGDFSELNDMVQQFLLGAEFSDSEVSASKTCTDLFKALDISAPSATETIQSDVVPLSVKARGTLGDAADISAAESIFATSNFLDFKKRGANATIELDAEKAKKETKEIKKAAKGPRKETASERAAKLALELEKELEAARVTAAQARARDGAYKGAIEASSFTLPNPGGGAPLLENAAFTLVRGRRYGLIGRNGKGKSTLLRSLAARRVGNIPANVTVHYVTQDVQLTEVTRRQLPVDCVVAADIERRLLLNEAAELEVRANTDSLDDAGQRRQLEVIERLQLIDADSAERRANELLENLGFTEELRARPLKALSGGWRVRTMLAAAIFARPDLLLLDEPTNHLSILAVMWLTRELSQNEVWKDRTVVIVSHDRYFMDEVCSDVLHISGVAQRLTQSHGNYSTWAARRKEQQITYAKEAALREAEIDKLREYAGHGYKYGGSASQINKMAMKAKQADKLEATAAEHGDELAALQEDVELPINLQSAGELDGFLIQLINVSFNYPNGPTLFSGADFGVTSKSRIVLLGENGNGKTSLIRLILGELEPTVGEIKRSHQMRIALVNQHHAEQIDLEMTPLQFMMSKFPGDGSYDHTQRLRGHLSSCGVTGSDPDLQNVPSSALSGGQRSRVALAAVSYVAPHVLVLDEPTNNLDLESVAALAESVKNFPGAVIVVSHDQYFVTKVANEAWVVSGGVVQRVESFDAYRSKQLKILNRSVSK